MGVAPVTHQYLSSLLNKIVQIAVSSASHYPTPNMTRPGGELGGRRGSKALSSVQSVGCFNLEGPRPGLSLFMLVIGLRLCGATTRLRGELQADGSPRSVPPTEVWV